MARPASDISQRIVRAARERFLVEGVDGASLRAIARDAGTNLGMVYYYFPNKDDLFLAVVEQVYATLLEEMGSALGDASLDTATRIERLYQRLSRLTDEEITVVRLILREGMSSNSQRVGRVFERFTRGHIALLANVIAAGRGRDEVRVDVPPMVLVMGTVVLGLLPQLVRRRLDEAGLPVDALLPPPPELARSLSNLLLDGLKPPANEPPKKPQAGGPGQPESATGRPPRRARSKG